jgi:hypothetical protein
MLTVLRCVANRCRRTVGNRRHSCCFIGSTVTLSLAILASVPRHSTDPGLSDRDRELLLRLETHGWYVIKVGAGAGEPAFAYSLGLYERFGHPELILFGLTLDTMHQLINDAGEQIKNGKRFEDGQHYDDLLDDYPCAFRLVRREEYGSHLTYTQWFYQGSDFPVLQMVWPDTNSCFPWDANFDEEYRGDQTSLYG